MLNRSLFKNDFEFRLLDYTDSPEEQLGSAIYSAISYLKIYKIGKGKEALTPVMVIHYDAKNNKFTLPCNLTLYALTSLDDWVNNPHIQIYTEKRIEDEVKNTQKFMKYKKATFEEIYHDYFRHFTKVLNNGLMRRKILHELSIQDSNLLKQIFSKNKGKEREFTKRLIRMLAKDLYKAKPDHYKRFERSFVRNTI